MSDTGRIKAYQSMVQDLEEANRMLEEDNFQAQLCIKELRQQIAQLKGSGDES